MGKLAQRLHLGVRGELNVELEREALLPGDEVVGAVRLTVVKPIPSAMLKVCVHGSQNLYWLTSSGESTISHSQTVDHWIDEIVLEKEDSHFDVGERSYACSFQLPLDLQHNFSFTCQRIEELQAVRISVKYAVVATLVVKGVATANLESQALFTVDPLPMAVPLGKPVSTTRTGDVKMFSMFKRGSCGVALRIADDVFDPTTTIEALVTLQLETTRKLKYVLLVLYEDAYVNRHHQVFRALKLGSRVVCCRRFDKATLAALHSASSSSTSPTAADTTRSSSSTATLLLRLPITPNDVSQFEPLNPTMASHFVNLSYRVGVECKLSMAPRVKVSVPVTIVRKLVAPMA